MKAQDHRRDTHWIDKMFTDAFASAALFWVFSCYVGHHPSNLREGTVIEEDTVATDRLAYVFNSPARADLVAALYPDVPSRGWLSRHFLLPDAPRIFTVIGLSGDRVELRRQRVYVNGHLEHYLRKEMEMVKEDVDAGIVPVDNLPPVQVPPGSVFVLSEDRDAYDSRCFGPLPEAQIIGRVTAIMSPYRRIHIFSWFSALIIATGALLWGALVGWLIKRQATLWATRAIALTAGVGLFGDFNPQIPGAWGYAVVNSFFWVLMTLTLIFVVQLVQWLRRRQNLRVVITAACAMGAGVYANFAVVQPKIAIGISRLRSDVQTARENAQRGIDQLQRLGGRWLSPSDYHGGLLRLSEIQEQAGHWQQAIDAAQQALEVAKQHSWPQEIRRTYLRLAKLQAALGHTPRALSLLDEAERDIGRKRWDVPAMVEIHAARAVILTSAGRTDEALAESAAAMRIASSQPGKAWAQFAAGIAELSAHQYERAVEDFARSSAYYSGRADGTSHGEIEDPTFLFLGMAEALDGLGKADAAGRYFRYTRIIAEMTGRGELLIQSIGAHASRLKRLGRAEESARAYEIVARLITAARASTSVENLQLGLGLRYSGILRSAANAHLSSDKVLTAYEFLEEAKARAFREMLARSKSSSVLPKASLIREIEKAYSDYRVKYKDKMSITAPELQRSLQGLIGSHYTGTDLVHEGMMRRSFIRNDERVGQLYIDDPLTAYMQYPRGAGIQEILESLFPGEMFVQFSITDEDIYSLESYRTLSGHSYFSYHKLQATANEITLLVRDFLAGVRRGERLDRARARRMYEILLKPALSERMASIRTVIVVPDGCLYWLPLEILDTGKGLIGERWKVAYYPSATVFAISRSALARTVGNAAHQTHPASTSGPLFAVGDPIFGPEDPRIRGAGTTAGRDGLAIRRSIETEKRGFSFERLENTAAEVLAVAKQFEIPSDSTDILLGAAATESEIKKRNLEHRLGSHTFYLFATHALLDVNLPDVNEPALVLSLVGDQNGEDGFLTASEILRLDFSGAELVVLSACQTALGGEGSDPAGEGMIGLVQAFLNAGSRSVIASLWPVDDRATSILIRSLFSHLAARKTKSEALELARRDVKRIPEYAAPVYWAGFILVGEP